MLGMSPTPVLTTGIPDAMASSTDNGWLSTNEELRNIEWASYKAGIDAGSTGPRNRTFRRASA
jgi:hypothetical protein